MKKLILSIVSVFFAAAAFAADSSSVLSAEADVFQSTTRRLEPNGVSMTYLNFEKMKANLPALLDAVGSALFGENDPDGQLKRFFRAICEQSGVCDFAGCGSSVVALKDGAYRETIFFYAPPERRNGVIWKMFDCKPHSFSFERYPKNASLAWRIDLNGEAYFNAQNSILKAALPDEDASMLKAHAATLRKQGVDLRAMARSIRSAGFWTSAPANEFAERLLKNSNACFDFAVMLETRDRAFFTTIFNFASRNFPELIRDGRIQIAVNPEWKLEFFELDGLVVLTTRPEFFRGANAETLADSKEFQACASSIRSEGNAFFYLSDSGAFLNAMTLPPPQRALAEKIFPNAPYFSVAARLDDGILIQSVSRSERHAFGPLLQAFVSGTFWGRSLAPQ